MAGRRRARPGRRRPRSRGRLALAASLWLLPPWLLPPYGAFARDPSDAAGVGLFVAAGTCIAVLGGRMRAARAAAEAAAENATRAAAENARLADELRQAARRKDEFLAMLAHELRNPLAPISNALQAWPLVADDPAELDRLRETMGRQVRHLSRLIDDLLDVSRVTRGKVTLKRTTTDLKSILATAAEGARPLVDAKRQRLALDVPNPPPPVDGDPVRLVQVFANLIGNAAKYSADGGRIDVACRVEPAVEGPARAVVTVTDDGIGISADMLPKVFDLFFQADGSLARSQGGLGIGLTLAKALVELHGGTIDARSDGPGRGSTFTVTLPLAPVPPAADRSPGAASALSRRRVLVVDDLRPSANTLAVLLKGLGQETRVAYDGPSALAALDDFPADLMLLDIGMPGMDGYEVARRVHARDPAANGRPLLAAVTGYGEEADRRRALESGFDRHLVKPVSVDTLRDLLASARAGA